MATQDLAKLVVRLEAQTAEYSRQLKAVEKNLAGLRRSTEQQLRSMDRRWSAFGRGLSRAFAGISVGLLMRQIVKETTAAERSLANLENAVKNNAGAAGVSTRELTEFAGAMQKVTTFGDEAVQDVQALLLRFKQIGDSGTFQRATKAVLDVSTAMGVDATAAAKAVGRALADPVRGMQALTRMGVVFTAQQREQIKALVESGRAQEAQAIILASLEDRFEGAAEAAGRTFAGALEGIKNDLGDLLEVKDGLPAATASLVELRKVLQDPAVKTAADTLFSAIIRGAAAAAQFVGELVAGLTVLAGMRTGDPIEDLTRDIEGLDAAIARSEGWGGFWGLFGSENTAKLKAQRQALLELQQQYIDFAGFGSRAMERFNAAASRAGGAAPGLGVGDPEAIAQIEMMIEKLREQVATFGQGETAALRYAIANGELAEVFAEAGSAAGPLQAELLGLSQKLENMKAAAKGGRASLADLVVEARKEVETFGMGAVAVLEYELRHRALRGEFKETGAELERLTAELLEYKQIQEELAQGEANFERAQELANEDMARAAEIAESVRTPHEQYLAVIEELNRLNRNADGSAGPLGDPDYYRAVQAATDTLLKNLEEGADKASEFRIAASRAVQGIISDFLLDPFEDGLDGLARKFGEMLRQLAAQAIAARIAEKLFGGEGVGSGGGAFGTFFNWIGGLFGGTRDRGGRGYPGMVYEITPKVGSEFFVPDRPGTFVTEGQLGGGYEMHFHLNAPAGQVSRQTMQQITAAAARGAAQADRRNN